MFGRPSFGVSQPNTFGFGNTASTSFGQPNQLFGGTTSTFGAGSSGFGSTSQPMFGNTQQSAAPLFGSTTTPAFGQASQTSGFGSSLFGNAQQPTSSGGMFGTTANTSFGQQTKPTGFGFPSSSAGGLFGQNTQPQQPNASSMFTTTSSTPLFGTSSTFGTGQAQTGTVNKFVPVTGTDSVQKSGILQSINTKHHCITCMKEYENKSLEELRWEDYQANRKGSQQQPPTFGSTNQSFGIASTNSNLFGQTENKPAFGQSSTAFAQSNFGMSSQPTAPNMFGKPSTGFGATSTTNSFTFGTGTPSTGLFGNTTASKPFGTTTQPLFGTTQPQQNAFGNNMFGQPNTQTTQNLFGKPAQQGFNMGQSTFQFGSQPSNQSSVFQSTKPNTTGFNIFGQPNNTNTNTFGQPQQQTTFTPFNNFAKPAQPPFGQQSQLTFGTGMQPGSLLGSNQQKSLFTPNNSLFGNNFQQNTGFNMPTQQQQQHAISNLQSVGEAHQQERTFLQLADYFGYHPHLDTLSPSKLAASSYTTNPKELQRYLETPQPIAIVTPNTKRLKVLPPVVKKANLFDDDFDDKGVVNFTLRRSAKRLLIKKTNSSDSADSENAIEIDVDGSKNEPGLMESRSKGPPLLIPALRLRSKSPLADDYSCSDLTNFGGASEKDNKSIDSRQSSNTNITADTYAESDRTTIPNMPDTCGIILTRPEYYTVPPLEKLADHKDSDGHCFIKGFTIGRIGYGNVSFPDSIDVANLNLDEILHFRYRELTIYTNDELKPPVGQGLNRRAQITLDRVFPKNKVDRKLITDINTLTSINFADTLRGLCEKHGTNFLDYRPETGSWVFMVDHFSKYGYNDSDDEPEQGTSTVETQEQKDELKIKEIHVSKEIILKNTKQNPEDIEQMIPNDHVDTYHSPILMDEDDIMLEDDQLQSDSVMSDAGDSIENIDMDIPTVPSSDSLHQVKSRRDLYKTDGGNIFVMKATFFEDEDFVPVNIESDNIETISKTGRLIKEFAKPPQMKRKVDRLDKQKPRVFPLLNKTCTIPMNKSLYNNRSYMDIAVFKGRSFKVGWNKGYIMASAWNGFHIDVPASKAKNRIEILDVSNLSNFDPFLDSLPEHMKLILEASEVKLTDGMPLFSIHQANNILLKHQNIANATYQRDINNKQVAYYKETWDLVVALWGTVPYGENRRKQLSKWFQIILKRNAEDKLKNYGENDENEIFEKIFIHLTDYQLKEASDLAMKKDLSVLSLLISQMNFSGNSRRMLADQMEQWKISMALDLITGPIQKIYMLFAGLLLQSDRDIDENLVNVCENLNWKQCLAIMLWYITPSSEKISTAINLYRQSFTEESIAAKPTPEHLDENSKIFDIQYHLLLLHTIEGKQLEEILNPLTHSSYGSDYRLSWLLMQILTALGVGLISEDGHTYLTTSFSMQLESLGLWKWAVFVLLFIKDSCLRKNLVFGSLHRNLTVNATDKIEGELVKDMCIPPQWIHEVKSYKTNLLSMHWQSYKHLCYTKFWDSAHKIAMDLIIPDLILNEKFTLTKEILDNLRDHESIHDWDNQGRLLLDFFKIVDTLNEERDIDKHVVMNSHSALLDVCSRIHNYPMRTSKEIAAVSELSKRCYIYGKLLLNIMNPSYEGVITVTDMEIERLIMPADYVFTDLLSDDLSVSIDNH